MLKETKIRSRARGNPLEVIFSSMLPLYQLAKQCHFNVTGPSFYGDHKTYDGIADVAIDWFDILGERMRALQIPVSVSGEGGLVTVPSVSHDADNLLKVMLGALENVSGYINANVDNVDNTTSNMLQELDAALGKQAYFVRSSM